MTNVAICTPHGGGVPPEYYRRVMTMQNHFLQHAFFHMEVDLMIIGKARVILVESVLAQIPEAEVLWFIDNDVMISEDSGVLIEGAMEYGIVSGLYFNRHSPYTPQMYKFSALEGEEGMYEPIIDYPDRGYIMVDGVGAGCLAVRRDVVEKMRDDHTERLTQSKELIAHKIRYDGQAKKAFKFLMRYAENLSPWFEFLDRKGEDFYFCEKAREAGFMVFVNLDVKCTHIGPIAITEGHFQYMKDNNLYVRVGADGVPLEQPQAEEVEK